MELSLAWEQFLTCFPRARVFRNLSGQGAVAGVVGGAAERRPFQEGRPYALDGQPVVPLNSRRPHEGCSARQRGS